jgi:hypothetical protein
MYVNVSDAMYYRLHDESRLFNRTVNYVPTLPRVTETGGPPVRLSPDRAAYSQAYGVLNRGGRGVRSPADALIHGFNSSQL